MQTQQLLAAADGNPSEGLGRVGGRGASPTASPWDWLHDQVESVGAVSSRPAWPLDPADARELSSLADTVVTMARTFAPERCRAAAECYQLTRDARESVRLMIEYLRQPDLLNTQWVSAWREAA